MNMQLANCEAGCQPCDGTPECFGGLRCASCRSRWLAAFLARISRDGADAHRFREPLERLVEEMSERRDHAALYFLHFALYVVRFEIELQQAV